jgi:hypothetical protein
MSKLKVVSRKRAATAGGNRTDGIETVIAELESDFHSQTFQSMPALLNTMFLGSLTQPECSKGWDWFASQVDRALDGKPAFETRHGVLHDAIEQIFGLYFHVTDFQYEPVDYREAAMAEQRMNLISTYCFGLIHGMLKGKAIARRGPVAARKNSLNDAEQHEVLTLLGDLVSEVRAMTLPPDAVERLSTSIARLSAVLEAR